MSHRRFMNLFIATTFSSCALWAQTPSPTPPQVTTQASQTTATPTQQNKGTAPQAQVFGNVLQVVGGTAATESTPPDKSTQIMSTLRLNIILTPKPFVLQIHVPDSGMVANYHFPGDPDFHAFPKEGVPLPQGVNMVLVRLTRCSGQCQATQPANPPAGCGQATAASLLSDEAACERDIVFVRDLFAPDKEHPDEVYLQPAFIISADGLQIASALPGYLKNPSHPNYTVNGTPVTEFGSQGNSEIDPTGLGQQFGEPIVGWHSIRRFRIERYAGSAACTEFDSTKAEILDIDRPTLKPEKNTVVDNGIVVAPAKVFDSFTLRQMLANTSAQLAGISGFNQGVLMGALGNIQGITRDTSYVSGQVTTLAPPSVTSTAVNGGTSSNTLANTLGVTNGTTISNSTITCPPGTLPGIGTSGLPACAAVVAGTATVGSTGAGNSAGGANTVASSSGTTGTSTSSALNTGQTANQQNTVTTTAAGQAGVSAAVPTSTAFSAPTNLGMSTSDMLAEQVQLNSEITTLRLLLQGALSDQYLVKETRAIGSREQTTVGFGINLDPPARFRHAVAEVRIYIEPDAGTDPVSVMNLLPAAKTYNVARITSHQSAFGAGVVVEPVNVGAATGKSKDRLYLAKDTDTVALQYQLSQPGSPPSARGLHRTTQEHFSDWAKEVVIWQEIDDTCKDVVPTGTNAIVFGWQFRPVLGADYVQAGQRLVYAQLALPVGVGEQYAPRVHVQTRWREYDEKRQVLGAVYEGSCSIEEDVNPITVVSPLRVHTVYVNDLGGGILKVAAKGSFFSSGFVAMNGASTIAPTTFDGQSLELFAGAQSLLLADDLELVGEDGTPTRLATASRFHGEQCGLKKDSLTVRATPRPDGNSQVEVKLTTGENFSITADGQPKPFILIGAQTYGLRETPFIDAGCTQLVAPATGAAGSATGATGPATGAATSAMGAACTYRFLAATDVLRTAERLHIADLAWTDFRGSGAIAFDPAFAGISLLATQKAPAAGGKVPKKGPLLTAAPPPQLYMLTGFELDGLARPRWNCHSAGCFALYRGLEQFCLAPSNFQVLSKTNAVLSLDDSKEYPTCVAAWAAEVPAIVPMAGSLAAVSQYEYKSLRLMYYPATGPPIEWALPVPSATPTAVTASEILNVGDSTQLTFNGVALAGTVQSLMFESMVFSNTAYKYDGTKQTLTVQIPSALTAKAGHKELIVADSVLNSGGKTHQILLPFDVTRR